MVLCVVLHFKTAILCFGHVKAFVMMIYVILMCIDAVVTACYMEDEWFVWTWSYCMSCYMILCTAVIRASVLLSLMT